MRFDDKAKPIKNGVLIISLALGLFAGGGYFLSSLSPSEEAYQKFEVFTQALRLIETNYVEPVAGAEVMKNAYRTLVESFDPYGSYLTEEEAQNFKNLGSKAHPGLSVIKRNGYGYVVSVRRGSPAEEAGIKYGVYIRAIDKKTTRSMSLFQIEWALRGAPQTSVDLIVVEWGKPGEKNISVKRASEDAKGIIRERHEGAVVLYLTTFNKNTERALKEAIEGAKHPVILDLRQTFSNDYDSAVRIADLFIAEGEIARLKTKNQETTIFATNENNLKISAVLVDKSTAGGAELIAGALKKHSAAEVAGETTFGFGQAQELIPLEPKTFLYLSTKEYLLPDGEKIEGSGIEPNILASDDADTPKDEALEKTLQIVREKAK